ncbi:TrmB family transcriptional regulator [Halobacterium noricense]|uniref:TrmB family transcriptional regulator n=1 Tax=Halobacterium noricense TaxID=223182 RepID=UPI001E64ADDE|nr:TrmB family transcriptional regulator [Halobacterium noricense]UHH27194.1 TrmB family transcriptional regulator [Halobacterium noricense]
MTNAAFIDELTRFGLSEKEVLAYLTILRNGSTKVSEISTEADISKSYAYDIIDELENRGLVEIHDHQVPTQIEAIQPQEGIEDLVSQLYTIGERLEQLYDSSGRTEQEFKVLKARKTLLNQINELISSAEEEVVLSIPGPLFDHVNTSIKGAYRDNVFSVLMLSDYDGQTVDECAHVVRSWDAAAPLILTVDRSYGIVAPAEMLVQSNSDKRAIFHAEAQIVSTFFDSFIANYWPMATQEWISQIHEFPQTYSSFRHAVFDATLELFDHQTIRAEIAMRPAQTSDEFETAEVTVVDVKQSLIRPVTNQFPTQETLIVKRDDIQFSVGGSQAFTEDFEATQITLSAGE